jgi:hypothetical protein
MTDGLNLLAAFPRRNRAEFCQQPAPLNLATGLLRDRQANRRPTLRISAYTLRPWAPAASIFRHIRCFSAVLERLRKAVSLPF